MAEMTEPFSFLELKTSGFLFYKKNKIKGIEQLGSQRGLCRGERINHGIVPQEINLFPVVLQISTFIAGRHRSFVMWNFFSRFLGRFFHDRWQLGLMEMGVNEPFLLKSAEFRFHDRKIHINTVLFRSGFICCLQCKKV